MVGKTALAIELRKQIGRDFSSIWKREIGRGIKDKNHAGTRDLI